MKTHTLVFVGLMTSITCILSPISIAIPISPVPITLGLFAILLSSILLGPRYGTISCLLYLLLGFVGLPVFSGFSGGAGVLLGPTGGYLCGYVFIPLLSGLFPARYRKQPRLYLLQFLPGLLLCYISGTFWLGYHLNIPFLSALAIGVLPYLPADLIKTAAALVLGRLLCKRLHRAGLL